MATQSDLDRLNRAINSGALRVRDHDGSEVQYRTLDEMLRARDAMKAEIEGVNESAGLRVRRMKMGKGLC